MTDQTQRFEVQAEWVHVKYAETSRFKEVYGFAGNQGVVNLEGIRYLPRGHVSQTLLIYMHPASTLQLLPMPRAMAERGVHVLCAASRYARNDTALIMENVVVDLGAYMRHAREVWGYRKIVIAGWSGGGSLALFYQSQAEKPTITHTPAGDPCNIMTARADSGRRIHLSGRARIARGGVVGLDRSVGARRGRPGPARS